MAVQIGSTYIHTYIYNNFNNAVAGVSSRDCKRGEKEVARKIKKKKKKKRERNIKNEGGGWKRREVCVREMNLGVVWCRR